MARLSLPQIQQSKQRVNQMPRRVGMQAIPVTDAMYAQPNPEPQPMQQASPTLIMGTSEPPAFQADQYLPIMQERFKQQMAQAQASKGPESFGGRFDSIRSVLNSVITPLVGSFGSNANALGAQQAFQDIGMDVKNRVGMRQAENRLANDALMQTVGALQEMDPKSMKNQVSAFSAYLQQKRLEEQAVRDQMMNERMLKIAEMGIAGRDKLEDKKIAGRTDLEEKKQAGKEVIQKNNQTFKQNVELPAAQKRAETQGIFGLQGQQVRAGAQLEAADKYIKAGLTKDESSTIRSLMDDVAKADDAYAKAVQATRKLGASGMPTMQKLKPGEVDPGIIAAKNNANNSRMSLRMAQFNAGRIDAAGLGELKALSTTQFTKQAMQSGMSFTEAMKAAKEKVKQLYGAE